MDKNSWIGLLMIIVVLFGWSYFTKPSEEEIARQKQKQDSIANVIRTQQLLEAQQAQQTQPQQAIVANKTRTEAEINDEANQFYGDFAAFANADREYFTIENELIKVTFSNLGGRIYSVELKNYKTHDSLPLLLFDGDSTEFGLKFFAQNRNISTNQLYFNLIQGDDTELVTDHAHSIIFGLNIDADRYIEYVYTINPESYIVDFDINMKGMQDLITTNSGFLDLNWKTYIPSAEKGRDWELQNTTIFYKFYQDAVESISGRSESDREDLTTRVKWVSFKQQFFNSTLIADNYFSNGVVTTEQAVSQDYLKQFSAEVSLPYDGKPQETFPMQFYFGPNHYKTLKGLDIELEKLVEMGMSIIRWVNVGMVIPLFNWLGKYIANYGLIILLMTIIIKIVIFPFTYKSYMSSAKMKALKPEVDKIGEKFPKKEDAMKKQQATMALYKKVGVSPMGGCLPMLFQMPILIAMFRFFPNSIELRQQSFLWATDLSTYDSIANLPFEIPFYGSHISLFTLLMTIVNLIYMKTNDQMNASNQQMPGMKMMMYMMPIMMLFWFNSYASALSYYYFISLLITIIQTWLIRRTVNDEEILAKLKAAQANKKAPTKSKWQKRMEEMAKQRGMQMPKK